MTLQNEENNEIEETTDQVNEEDQNDHDDQSDNAEESEQSLRDVLTDAMEGTDDETEDSASTDTEEKNEDENDDSEQTFDHPFDGQNGKSYKAPASWKPSERENWTKIPVELQARIKAREAETDNILRETAEARRTHEFMNQLGTSYAPVFAAEGVQDVPTGIKGMVDTIALLQNGSPADKAVKMAQLISHYGIDIGALDSALVGEAPQNSQESELQQLIDQRMQPVNQLLQRLDQTQQQSVQQSQEAANKQVAEFKGEFLSDVRNDMADLLDMAAARNQPMSLQEAYDKAVILRPDLQKILTKRKQNEELTGRRNNIGNKMNAASSISGSRGGMASGNSDSLRGAIEDAWDETA
jgi:hypothetical protein